MNSEVSFLIIKEIDRAIDREARQQQTINFNTFEFQYCSMADLKSILSHSSSIVSKKTGDEFVLVPIANNIADMNSVFTLNETGAFIWEHIDGKRSVEEIITAMTNEYEIDFENAEKDVFSFISDLNKYLVIK